MGRFQCFPDQTPIAGFGWKEWGREEGGIGRGTKERA